MNIPKVSIVMPAYNAAKTIAESINSVLAQSFTDWELIIVDDCSTDETAKILNKYVQQEVRIIFVKNNQNLGVAESRNRAIAMAKGQWVAFLDSDDLWRSDKLEKQVVLMQSNSGIDMTYTASGFIDVNGNSYDYVMSVPKNVTYNSLLHGNVMSCSSVMIKSDLMKHLPMPQGNLHEDYYCWLTLLKAGRKSVGINEQLLIYRLGVNTRSSSRIKAVKMSYNTYRAIGISCMKSLYLVMQYVLYSVKKRKKIKG